MPYTKETIDKVNAAFDKEYAIFTSGTIIKNTVPDAITFNTSSTWAMRIRKRKIEVNPEVEVTEAAQAVFDVLAPMIKKQWVGLTDEEFHDLQIKHVEDPWANFKAIETKLKEKNT